MASTTDHAPRSSLPGVFMADWRILIAVVMAALAATILYLHNTERRYAVTFALVPTEESGRASSTLGGGLGNLASLAGVDLSQGSGSLQFELLPDAIVSQETAQEIARDPVVMKVLFAPYWDDRAGIWREPPGVVADAKRAIASISALAFGGEVSAFSPPGSQELLAFMNKEVSVAQDRKRPVVTLSILHSDPKFAKALLQRLWEVTDRRMKNSALTRSTANIDYLSRRLSETQTMDYRLYLLNVMSQEEKRRMTTISDMPYVSEPFGGPVASARPVYPDVFFTLATGIGVGFLLGIGLISILRWQDLKPIFSNMLRDE